MGARFIINELIIFDTESLTLYTTNGDASLCLAGTKGRCLLSLLNAKDNEIITKKQLHFEVWENFGLYSNDNCLLQTIYTLRKELKKLEIGSIIITLPRLGYKINPDYKIQYLPNESSVSLPEEATPLPIPVNITTSRSASYCLKMKKTLIIVTVMTMPILTFLYGHHINDIYLLNGNQNQPSSASLAKLINMLSNGESPSFCKKTKLSPGESNDIFICNSGSVKN